MKYLLIFLLLTACQKREATVAPAKIPVKSQNLGYMGTYENRCAHCDEPKISLQISENFTYTLEGTVKSKGKYRWSADGKSLILARRGLPDVVLKVSGPALVFISTGDTLHKATEQKLPDSSAGTIPEGRWMLIELKGKATRKLQKQLPFMTVESPTQFTAFAGCNSIGGKFKVNGYSIEFYDVVQTEMACSGADLEAPFVEMFSLADNFIVNGKSLQLRKGQSVMAKFEAVAGSDESR